MKNLILIAFSIFLIPSLILPRPVKINSGKERAANVLLPKAWISAKSSANIQMNSTGQKESSSLSEISGFPYQSSIDSAYESTPVILGDGSILVAWSQSDKDSIFASKSTDGGLTWDSPVLVNFTNGSCHSMSGIRTTSGRTIVIWQNNLAGIIMCFSDNDCITWSSLISITSNTNDLNATLTQTLDEKLWLFYSRSSASTSHDIFYRTSTDNGTSWSGEQTFLATSNDELLGTVISKDTASYIAFYDDNSSGNDDIYMKTSTDGGTTWSPAISVVNSPESETSPHAIRQSDGTLWLIYQYYKPSTGGYTQAEIFYRNSTDGGSTWTNPAGFTNYAGADVRFNACLFDNKPFVTFQSDRWCLYSGQTQLWYGIIETSVDANPPPALTLAQWSIPTANSHIPVKAYVDDEFGISNVILSYHINGKASGPIQMFDDGAHDDSLAGDNIWGGTIGPVQLGDRGNFTIGITDAHSNVVYVFISPFSLPIIHDAGNIILNFSTNSQLADQRLSLGSCAYWPKTGGYNYLCDGGLWIGCNVSGTNRVMAYEYSDNDWAKTSGTSVQLASGISDLDGYMIYDDQYAPYNVIGLQVHQRSYQWTNSNRDDFIIFKYTVKNRGTNGTLNDIYVGSWHDADVAIETSASQNMVGYDSDRNLLYIYNATSSPSGYYGVKLLGAGKTPHTVKVYPFGQDPLDDNERYLFLTNGIGSLPGAAADYRLLLTSSPFSLAPSQSAEVAFGIVLGDGLSELQANADTMEYIYNTDIPTAIVESRAENKIIPQHFGLQQNYPNPFNPSTKINYQLPVVSKVTLKIYNVLGKEIATLINGVKPAGAYEITYNATTIPTGVYFYRLQAHAKNGKGGNYSETRKFVVIK